MQDTKICFVCETEKAMVDFYKHKAMADGHLNKCKACTKEQSKAREVELRKNPEWVEKEKVRARDRYKRLGYCEKQKEWNEKRPWTKTQDYKNQSRDVKNNIGISDGYVIHHWNYKELNSVFIMPSEVHRRIHIDLQNEGYLFTQKSTLSLLDTCEKHYNFLKSKCSPSEINKITFVTIIKKPTTCTQKK